MFTSRNGMTLHGMEWQFTLQYAIFPSHTFRRATYSPFLGYLFMGTKTHGQIRKILSIPFFPSFVFILSYYIYYFTNSSWNAFISDSRHFCFIHIQIHIRIYIFILYSHSHSHLYIHITAQNIHHKTNTFLSSYLLFFTDPDDTS